MVTVSAIAPWQRYRLSLVIVCERYALLPNDKKQMIAGELDRSVREIERKISVNCCKPTPYSPTS